MTKTTNPLRKVGELAFLVTMVTIDGAASIAALCSRIKEMSASVLDRQDIFDA